MKASLKHEINFGHPGKSFWTARISWREGAASGGFDFPVFIVNNRPGPTLLLSGGVHGDEFEGPACLWEMARNGAFDSVMGRLIVLPTMNPPALTARQRRSPLDGQDMNRSFPGKPDGSPTDVVAHFVSTEIIPITEAVFDLHAGGEVEFIAPSIMTLFQENDELFIRTLKALEASGLPVILATEEFDDYGMIDAEAVRQQKVFGCAELGSVGATTTDSIHWTKSAIRNLLRHFGMFPGDQETIFWQGASEQRYIRRTENRQTVTANFAGLFYPKVSVGDVVRVGDELGVLLSVFDTKTPDQVIHASTDGFVYIVNAGRTVEAREMIAVIAKEVDGIDRMRR